MTELSREVLQNWEVRKSKQQKEDFRGWLCRQLEAAGYAPQVEKHKTLWASHNVVAGDPDKAKVLLTYAAKQTIKNGLALLGIKAPEKM